MGKIILQTCGQTITRECKKNYFREEGYISTSPITTFLFSLVIILVDCIDLLSPFLQVQSSPPWTWLLWALLWEMFSLKPVALVVIKPMIIFNLVSSEILTFSSFLKIKFLFLNQNNTLIYLHNQTALSFSSLSST